jgi:hypothetical protein
MPHDLAAPNFSGDLGDGLIRRWSTQADAEKIALLLSTVHRDRADEPLNPRSQDLAHVLMSGKSPFMAAGDFAVVEDAAHPDRPLVACTCLWRHRWRYADIPLKVGRPEYVATLVEYRNRGLVRGLFDMVHARSQAEGHLLQAITGIPYFYRQFGYEFVLELEGSRTVYFSAIPENTKGEPEPFALRPATHVDIPALAALYQQQRRDSLLWYEPDGAYWRFNIDYWDDPAVLSRDVATLGVKGRFYMIVDKDGAVVGGVWARTRRWNHSFKAIPLISAAPAVNRQATATSLLRLLRDLGAATPGSDPDTKPCSEIVLELGLEHPLYELLGEKLALRVERPYAWYVRIPDLPAFLRTIAPALEERLARSALAGYSGELKIDLYRGGLHLRFDQGRLVQVTPWRPPTFGDEAMAGSPPLLFLQLLLSYRSLDELRAFYPDVWADERAKLLLDTLFPKSHSWVMEPPS